MSRTTEAISSRRGTHLVRGAGLINADTANVAEVARALRDVDGDTNVWVEKTTDDDTIRFDAGGVNDILDITSLGLSNIEFAKQASNPGVDSTKSLYQDDGTNYDDGTLVWNNKSVFLDEMSIGDPGFEQGDITVNGTTYDAIFKVNEFGDTRLASQILHRHSDTTNVSANLVFARARGATASHTVVQDGDVIGELGFVGHDGTDYAFSSTIRVEVDGTPGNNDMPGRFVFKTSSDGAQNPTERLRLGASSAVWNNGNNDYDFQFKGTSTDNAMLFDAAEETVFINGSQPITFTGGTALELKLLARRDDSDVSIGIGSLAHSDTAGRGGVVFGGRSRGTETSPTVVQNSDNLFDFSALGHDGTDFGLAATIRFKVDSTGTVSSTSMPGRLSLRTSPDLTTSPTEKFAATNDGVVFNDDSNGYSFRAETIGDEYGLYNDGIIDTWSMGTSVTSITINALTVKPKILVDRGGGDSNINFICLSNLDSSSAGAFNVWARARGSGVGPSTFQAVQNGDRGGTFRMDMHDGTQFITAGDFAFAVDAAVSTNIVPTSFTVRQMDSTGTLFTAFSIASNGRLFFNPAGGTDITLFDDGGIRANQNKNSAATADFIYSSATYSNQFRLDVSANQTNVSDSNNTQGALFSADSDDHEVRINKFNTDCNLVVESSSAGVNLWESDTTNDIITQGTTLFTGRHQADKGADVASANTLTLGGGGNVFDITGTTTINNITVTDWQSGSEITLKFDGVLQFTHAATGSGQMFLAGSGNLTTAVNTRIKLFLDGTDWYEISRTVA